ncbi:hypothetical protein ACKAV7_007026 [Fusarium commune]
MRATRFSLTFVALALCSSGHAGPCKPKSSTTALVGTTSTEATLSASAEISTATSVAESSTTDLSSIISESITSTATATSDSQFSSSTELSTSFITTETAIATTSAAELSSSAETLTTSNTAEATTYWSVENTAQNGVVRQTVTLEENKVYTLSYWWYVDEDEQPQNIDCYITLEQRSTDGTTATFAGFQALTTPLPLKIWTKEETGFNSITITPAVMSFSVVCASSAGSGLKIAIDDVYMAKQA